MENVRVFLTPLFWDLDCKLCFPTVLLFTITATWAVDREFVNLAVPVRTRMLNMCILRNRNNYVFENECLAYTKPLLFSVNY